MAVFQLNINVHRGTMPPQTALSFLVDTLTAMLRDVGWIAATANESSSRSLFAVQHGTSWITILDDESERNPESMKDFAKALHRHLNLPVTAVVVNDNIVDEVSLFLGGNEADRVSLWEPDGPNTEAWSAVMENGAPSRNDLAHLNTTDRMLAFVNALGFDLKSWFAMGDAFANDQASGGALLRFQKATARTAAAPSVECDNSVRTHGTMIPSFLCGLPRDAKRKWKKIQKTLVEAHSWRVALAGTPFVPIELAPEPLVLEGPPTEGADADNVMLYVVPDSLCDFAAEGKYKYWGLVKDLIINGAQEFWVALAIMAGGPFLVPKAPTVAEERAFARDCLSRILVWWDQISALDSRFCARDWLPMPWPRWGKRVFTFCSDIGVPEKTIMRMAERTPIQASEILRSYLE